jgi:hypothetical protein
VRRVTSSTSFTLARTRVEAFAAMSAGLTAAEVSSETSGRSTSSQNVQFQPSSASRGVITCVI